MLTTISFLNQFGSELPDNCTYASINKQINPGNVQWASTLPLNVLKKKKINIPKQLNFNVLKKESFAFNVAAFLYKYQPTNGPAKANCPNRYW